MLTKEKLDSWYTPRKNLMQIEYTGQWCSGNCRRDGCPHVEIWAERLKNKFSSATFEDREKIIKWLGNNDFDDIAIEIYETHCHDCYGTGEFGKDENGYARECHCRIADRLSAETDAQWADR